MQAAADDRLPLAQEFLLEEHLRRCPRCQELAADHQHLSELLEALPEPSVEGADLERCLNAIRERVDSEPTTAVRPAAPRARRVAAAALAAGLLIACAFLWARSTPGDEGQTPLADEHPSEPGVGTPEEPIQPARELSAVAAVVVHQMLPGPPLSADLDIPRLASTQEEVRGLLVQAAREIEPEGAAAEAFAVRFEELAGDLRASDWPIGHLVSGLIDDPDAQVANAAARYTGVRATRVAVSRLQEALDQATTRRAATLALIDAGELGERGLARAFWLPEVSGVVEAELRHRTEQDPSGVALWVDRALAARPRDGEDRAAAAERLVDLLAECGPEGARSLFTLAGDGRIPKQVLASAFARAEGAGEVLGAILETRRARRQEHFLLLAIEELAFEEAFEWVRGRAWYGERRGLAARVLAGFGGVEPLAALLELDEARRVGAEELAHAWRVAVEGSGERVLARARAEIAGADRRATRRYLDWLVISGRAEAVPALVELAVGGALDDAERERALLAAGELGGEAHVPLLATVLTQLAGHDRDLAAASLLVLHRLGGAQAVTDALPGADPAALRRVLELLDTEQRDAALRFHLARLLEPVFSSQAAPAWRNSR